MTILVAGLVIFFSTHLFTTFRSRAAGQDIKERMGEKAYMGIYSIISIIGFGLIIWGYNAAPGGDPLFVTPLALRWVSALLLLLGFVLLVAAFAPAGKIKRWAKHPMITAVGMWGLAHLLYGGDLVAVLIFGSFLVYAVLDRLMVMRRPDPVFEGAPSETGDVIAILGGAFTFFAFVYGLHKLLWGIAPVLPF
ncbi:MAG: NnrU family protein [Pseudomonadota bacterium]